MPTPTPVGVLTGFKEPSMSTYICHVRFYRMQECYSQAELAAEVGASRQMISLIETEKIRPSLDLAAKIAHYLGRPIEHIFVYTHDNDQKHRVQRLSVMGDRRHPSRSRNTVIEDGDE